MSQIFFIENPLLDISVELNDNSILDKYKLQHGMASLAGPDQLPIYEELWHMEGREAIPGGSSLNSARAAGFFLKNQGIQGKVTFFGCIGNDEKGQALEEFVEQSGVHGNFCKDPVEITGTCAVVVVEKERTLCANLAAACKYSIQHLNDNINTLHDSKIIYTSSFFITSNFEALVQVAEFATNNNIPFGFNLSAVFLIQFELEKVKKGIEHSDYLFANEDEAAAFGISQNLQGQSLQEIAKFMAKYKKANQKRPRVAIVTNGSKPIIVAINTPGSEDVQINEYPIEALPKDKVVDTNGAGDSFVGGFLSQLYQDQDLETCIRAGIYLSREVVQRSGCTFPENLEFSS